MGGAIGFQAKWVGVCKSSSLQSAMKTDVSSWRIRIQSILVDPLIPLICLSSPRAYCVRQVSCFASVSVRLQADDTDGTR
jgi:hypothetical protein